MQLKNIINSEDQHKVVHPSVFMFLFLPFGVMSGYISVTIGFILTRAGIPLEQVAPLIAMTLLPNIVKFLWAPLVDTTLSLKKWYIISNIITAL